MPKRFLIVPLTPWSGFLYLFPSAEHFFFRAFAALIFFCSKNSSLVSALRYSTGTIAFLIPDAAFAIAPPVIVDFFSIIKILWLFNKNLAQWLLSQRGSPDACLPSRYWVTMLNARVPSFEDPSKNYASQESSYSFTLRRGQSGFPMSAFICWVCTKHAVTPQALRLSRIFLFFNITRLPRIFTFWATWGNKIISITPLLTLYDLESLNVFYNLSFKDF